MGDFESRNAECRIRFMSDGIWLSGQLPRNLAGFLAVATLIAFLPQ